MPSIVGNSIKDYYIRLERMHNNVMNMLTAINQALVSNASEVTVTVLDSDDVQSTLRIPSFLYLENKLEQLDSNFGNLFNLPKSGEAWFTKNSSDIYKMNMVRVNTALPKPELDTAETTPVASITDNNILKDMVCPKTYIRYNISNLSDTAESAMMKKFVFFNSTLFNALNNAEFNSYSDFLALLDGYIIGTDYEVYESELKLPVKNDTLTSDFKVMSVDESDTGIVSDSATFSVSFDTIQYYDAEDSSIVYYIKKGDKLIYSDSATEYNVLSVDNNTNTVVLEEVGAHINIATYDENDANVFYVVNDNYNKYKYIDIPLEENDYIAVCVSVVYNGIRSNWSKPELLDLNQIEMTDENGNSILDSSGNKMSYIEYYNKYCQNIGDLILGITEAAYPQLSNFTASQLSEMQDGTRMTGYVTASITQSGIKVVPINKHLTDDTTNDEIISLHSQKNELAQKLSTVQSKIDELVSKMQSSSVSQDSGSSQATMQTTLSSYYTEKTELTKSFNSCVDQINEKAASLSKVQDKVKYRIRGLVSTDEVTNWLKSEFSDKVEIVGIEIWYKYKSVNNDTSSLTVINSDTFTEWNIQKPEEKRRYLSFNSIGNGFVTEYVNYSSTDNVPKWNQIDIPIKNGEDVVYKVRFIYNIGKPFISLVSPWSDEQTVTFPDEYKEDVQVSSIVDTNNDDTVSAAFSSTLINDGYTDHINDKTVSNTNVFFHTADHVYSGFNTSENNMMSLKEKLQQITEDINNYKELLDDNKQSKYKVSVVVDDTESELSENVTNKVSLYNINNTRSKFIKKTVTLKITNTSDYNVRLYSLFPGNIRLPLYYADINDQVNEKIADYERVPIQVGKQISPQYMGQWIYFRQKSAFDNVDIYCNDANQNSTDLNTAMKDDENYIFSEPSFNLVPQTYMTKNNVQVMLPYRYRMELNSTAMINKQLLSITKALNAMKAFMDEYGDRLIEQ